MIEDVRQKRIVEEAAEFADQHIRPFASEFDAAGKLPKELIEKMASRGYLAASFPEEYGGLALDPAYYGLFTEEIGKACSSTRAVITVHTSLVGETILRWGSEEQKQKWLPLMAKGEKIAAFGLTEPEVGTDAKSIETSYRKEGDKYILNGKKKWITMGDLADIFLVIASDENRKTCAFIVERAFAGVETKPITGLLASRAAHIAEINFENVEIPVENLLGQEGGGFTFIANTALDHGRYSIAWSGVAIAQEALDAMVTYSRSRKQFGKKIHSFQLIQKMIGDAVTRVHAARALCLRAAEMRMADDNQAIIETTIAKQFAAKVAMEVAVDSVQVHGGNGCSDKYPVERLFREAKILEIIEGTSQVLVEVIAKFGLREYYKAPKK